MKATRLMRSGTFAIVTVSAALASAAAPAAQHALLVGVSNYPSLAPALHLDGPRNDVVLMRTVLQQRGFPTNNIRVLADGLPGAADPTRAAIMKELDGLARRAQKGDFVFLLFAGHGSQQPARNLGPQNPEPDGLDEIFLPRDIGKWSGGTGSVQNAILDDELGAAIAAIRNRGAFVWAVFDTCHSGTITRGIADEGVRYRDVKPNDLGIPDAALARAAREAAANVPRTRGGSDEARPPMTGLQLMKVDAGAGGFVVFSAAQSWERAPEERLPAGHPDRRSQGVLTFTLSQVIAMNPGMSYRQAAQQILQRYRARNQSQPTPLFEGPSLDAPLFGAAPGAQVLQWRIEKADGALRVPAGALHQIAEGAIFAVVANPADPDKAALGYLAATKVQVLQSDVAPAEHGGRPRIDPAKVPEEAHARLVSGNLSPTLRIALPPDKPAGGRDGLACKAGTHPKARAVLERLARDKITGVRSEWVASSQSGDIRLLVCDDRLWLLPSSGAVVADGPARTPALDLAKNSEAELREKLSDSLRRIAKVNNLLRLAAQTVSAPVAQKLEIRMTYERGGKPAELQPNQVPNLRGGDKLAMRIANKNPVPVDVNLLFVDSQYGIQHVHKGGIEPDGQLAIPIGAIDASTTVGRESMLVIVTEKQAGAETADFGFLAQASLPATRGGKPAGGLREILETIGFEPERTRGLVATPRQTLNQTTFRLFTWNTVGN